MSRLPLLIVGILSVTTLAQAQTVVTFDRLRAFGVTLSELESQFNIEIDEEIHLYAPPVNPNGELNMLRDMGRQLGDSLEAWGQKWERMTTIRNRVFFNNDGTVEYFVYSALPSFASPFHQTSFEDRLTLFLKDFRLPNTPKTRIARCLNIRFLESDNSAIDSSVRFSPTE
jgi:hypothetical protein